MWVITNKTIPRTLLKNGKRSMEFLIEAPRPFSSQASAAAPPHEHTQHTVLSCNNQLSQGHSLSDCTPHTDTHQLPSSSSFSKSLISREINHLKDELRALRNEVAEINRRLLAMFPSLVQQQFGQELKGIKDEISNMQTRYTRYNSLPTLPQHQQISALIHHRLLSALIHHRLLLAPIRHHRLSAPIRHRLLSVLIHYRLLSALTHQRLLSALIHYRLQSALIHHRLLEEEI